MSAAQEKGDRTESRAFDALKKAHHLHPTIIGNVRRASPALDARGVDFLVQLNIRKGSRRVWMTIPIEVKSSEYGVKKWKRVHSEHHKAGVLIFAISNRMDQDELCGWFFSVLFNLRYKPPRKLRLWWKTLFGQMSERGQQIVEDIKKRRATKR